MRVFKNKAIMTVVTLIKVQEHIDHYQFHNSMAPQPVPDYLLRAKDSLLEMQRELCMHDLGNDMEPCSELDGVQWDTRGVRRWLASEAIREYCCESRREGRERDWYARALQHEGMHADDVYNVHPDPMDGDAVY